MAVGGNKCTSIHLESAASTQNQKRDSAMVLGRSTVCNMARIFRATQYEQSMARSRELGEPAPNDPWWWMDFVLISMTF